MFGYTAVHYTDIDLFAKFQIYVIRVSLVTRYTCLLTNAVESTANVCSTVKLKSNCLVNS